MLCNLWLKVTLIVLSLTIIQGSNVTVVSQMNDTQEASESDQKHVTMISFHQPKPIVDSKSGSKIGFELTPSSILNASQIINHYEVEVEDFDEPLHDQARHSHSNHLSYSKHKSLITDDDHIMVEPKSLQGYSKNVLPNFKPSISKSEMRKLIDFVENRTPNIDSTFPSSTHHSNHHFAEQPHPPQQLTQHDHLQQHYSQDNSQPPFGQHDHLQQHYSQDNSQPPFGQHDHLQQHYSQDNSQPPFGQHDHLQHDHLQQQYSQQDFSQQPHAQPLHIQSHHSQQHQQQQPSQYYSTQPHSSSQQHSPELNSLHMPPPPTPSLTPSHKPHNIHQSNSIMSDSQSIENMDDDLFLNQDGAIHGFIEPSAYGDSNEYDPELLDSRLIGYDSMVPAPDYTPAVYETSSLFSRILSALFPPYTRTFTQFGLQPMSFSLSQRSNPMMPFNFNPVFFSPMILKRHCRFNCNYGFLKAMSQLFRFRYKHWLSYV